MLDTLPLLLVLAVLIVASGLCSASETAFFSLRHADRARLRRSSPHAARRVNALLRSPRQLLLLILTLNMGVNVAYFATSTILGYRLESPAAQIALALGSLFALILVGEVLAKLLASTHRVAYASLVSGPLLVVRGLLDPLLRTVDHLVVGPVSRLIRPVPEFDAVDATELADLLRLSAGAGAIDTREEDLLLDVVQLGAARVREVMTPRVDMRVVERDASPGVIRELVRRTGQTKVPVRDGRDFVGMLDLKRYLLDLESDRDRLDPHLESIHFVPETARLDQLLDEFRRRGGHVALCVDEVGDVTGLIEIEDIVERLVAGQEELAPVRLTGLGQWVVPGRMPLRDWCDAFRVDLEDARVATVGGLLLSRLGRMPTPDDVVEIAPYRLRVGTFRRHHVELVIVELDDA